MPLPCSKRTETEVSLNSRSLRISNSEKKSAAYYTYHFGEPLPWFPSKNPEVAISGKDTTKTRVEGTVDVRNTGCANPNQAPFKPPLRALMTRPRTMEARPFQVGGLSAHLCLQTLPGTCYERKVKELLGRGSNFLALVERSGDYLDAFR